MISESCLNYANIFRNGTNMYRRILSFFISDPRLAPLICHREGYITSVSWSEAGSLAVSWVPRAQDQVVFLLCPLNTTCTVVS